VGQDAYTFFEALVKEGVIIRPLAGFGAPDAVRITVGTGDEHAFLAAALARLKTGELLPQSLPAG
jgi:histidinol-phosphate/aromatic aminotransferase/cobyric acid decarboxylase-like protein